MQVEILLKIFTCDVIDQWDQLQEYDNLAYDAGLIFGLRSDLPHSSHRPFNPPPDHKGHSSLP